MPRNSGVELTTGEYQCWPTDTSVSGGIRMLYQAQRQTGSEIITLMDVRLQIPDDVASVLQTDQPDLSRAALEALALEGYRSQRLSEGQVRRMLGFATRMQVHAFLKARNVHLNYSLQELEHDLASLKQFEETLTD